MAAGLVEILFEENNGLLAVLDAQKEISLRSSVENNFRKTLVLASASYFETAIKEVIANFVAERTRGCEPLLEFVKNKAIERQYHTYFEWKQKNANSFFGLFGEKFKNYMKAQLTASDELTASIEAFIEIGQLRNQLVHQNFATFAVDKTSEEVFELYARAQAFVDWFPQKLVEFIEDERRKSEQKS